jgi:spermidine synthase
MLINMRAPLLLSLGLLALGGSTSSVVAETDLVTPIVNWLVENDGFFNENLKVRRDDPDDPESRFGMFATANIAEDEVLIVVPRDLMITAGDDKGQYAGIWCPTVYNLVKELRLGDESHYAPYVNYLLSQEEGQLPSHWSEAGQALLLEMLGHDDDDPSDDLPPSEVAAWITHEWNHDCSASTDRFEQHAALLLVQRGWDDIMIPVYDMMSHRNGKWLNTKSNSVHKKSTPVTVKASRDIEAGEEIYTSYNFCKDCGNKLTGYGTAEILRDFGFVENYPQRWFFGRGIMFVLDVDEESGELEVEWIRKKPRKKTLRYLKSRLEQLKEFGDFELESVDPSIPSNELGTIIYYHESLVNAMQHALKAMGVEVEDSRCEKDDHSCALAVRYDDLSFKEDDLNYAVYTCDTDKSMSYEGWDTIEALHSHYQKIDYVKDPKNDNVCFDISNIIQMCGSYRPHYHEMVVHYTARFLDNIKRVLWVGGGDSMLLHDILKYPSLEFVVGLEIDQVVTRLSFKHLGTQPHFDNEKVQWWYGDAAKSLLMLPEDYFGSFDMVLVDLSETVMSLTVTDGLDIMQALSLLLKPDGIYVKNELYLEQMSDVFDYR